MFARAFPTSRLSLSFGRCAQHISVPAAPHVSFLVTAVHLLRGRSIVSRLSPLRSSRLSPRLALCFSGRCAQHCSRPLASSPSHVGCSPDHFPLARLPRLAAYIRRRCSRVRFASLRPFALFCFQPLFPRASPSASSCLASLLIQPRHPSSLIELGKKLL